MTYPHSHRSPHGVSLLGGHGDRAIEPDGQRFRLTIAPMPVTLPLSADPVWSQEESGSRYRSRFALFATDEGFVLDIDCEGKGRFLIGRDTIGVDWRGGTSPTHYLRTIGLALWLELRGVICLHANTLTDGNVAIGIMAPSQTGKSTLATAFTFSGWRILTDDMTALHQRKAHYEVFASGDEIRLWPDSGHLFYSDRFDECAPVHARFAKRKVPLCQGALGEKAASRLVRLFVLERRAGHGGEIELSPVSASDAVMTLMKNSIVGDMAPALDLEQARLKALGELVSEIRLVTVSYPSAMDQLHDVRRAVESNCRHLP